MIVLFTTIKMIRNILEVLIESTRREIDATRLEIGLREMEGVIAVYELKHLGYHGGQGALGMPCDHHAGWRC
jgi:hypothetical protein